MDDGELGRRLSDLTQRPVRVVERKALFGGACQDNWCLELEVGEARGKVVLRSDAPGSLPGSHRRPAEFAIIRAAVVHGVRTPVVRVLLPEPLRPGAGAYLMDWAEGEALGARVVRAPELAAARRALPTELAQVLARIHGITPANAARPPAEAAVPSSPLFPELPVAQDLHLVLGPGPTAAEVWQGALAAQRATLDALGEPRLGLELVLAWLAEHPPRSPEVVLVHGDFRTGNFLLRPEGLSAVLDWEFARWGSPFEDLAWLCLRDWRFGQLDLEAGGFTTRARFYEEYARQSGREVPPADVRFWEILGNVRWALGALAQGERARRGEADIELPAIARRAAEMEYEAMRLIERG